MRIFHILFTSFVYIIFAYDHSSLNNFVGKISAVTNSYKTYLYHYSDIQNGILVMDNIYFDYSSSQFDLYMELHTATTTSYRKVEVYDEFTGMFMNFINIFNNSTEVTMKYSEFKNAFLLFLRHYGYEANNFTNEQFELITKKMFDLESNHVLDDNFHIDYYMVKQTIDKNRRIFIDCNFTDLEEAVFSLVQIYKGTFLQYRLTPYFYSDKNIIYYHFLLNAIVENKISNSSFTCADKLVLTEYNHINKYLYEVLHFVKIAGNTLTEYIIQEPLEWFIRNDYGIIVEEIQKQKRSFTEFGILN